jgi:aspartyl-tRNA(Asn)/glutamyl-tRNA(Gln) amidotransferase subunit A
MSRPSITTISKLQHQLKEGAITPNMLLKQHINTINQTNPKLNSFITQSLDIATESAEFWTEKIKKGDDTPPLAGIPIAIKDNIHINGIKTTCASQFLRDFIAPFDATVTTQLKSAGAVLVGKLNLDEFAMGSSTETSHFGVTPNPWDLSRVSGGSSGGSAAAVASGQVVASLGSDTGGSIRQPASFCGVVGLKPTYGRVSRYGLVAFASSLDQIGPITRTVEDAAHILQFISGHDPHDATSSQCPVPDYLSTLTKDITGIKIAVPSELMGDEINDDVKHAILTALDQLKTQGATWEMVSMPSLSSSIATYYIIAPSEASSNLSRFDGVRYTTRSANAKDLNDMMIQSRSEGFGAEVKRRIILGTFALSSGYYDAYYVKAHHYRTRIQSEFNRLYHDYDVIISPTSPTTAFEIGAFHNNPTAMYLSDLATIAANMAGIPAISVPCGVDGNGLPIGLQIMGKSFDESTILRVADTYQSITDFHLKTPEH